MDFKQKIFVLEAWNYATDKIEVFYTLDYLKADRKFKELEADEAIGSCSLDEFDLM